MGKVRLVSREGTTRATTSVEELLTTARARLNRLGALEAYTAVAEGATLVDIRSDSQRASQGIIAEARHIPRNELEWRLDPASPWRDPQIAVAGHKVILICNEGYQSSLAAATLRDFGLDATDVIDGFTAWRRAGLPVVTAAIDAVAPAFGRFSAIVPPATAEG
jgi:rhodanese-related sulfurtransferase